MKGKTIDEILTDIVGTVDRPEPEKVAEVRRLRVLEEENRKLKQLVADLSLDKQMLQDVLRKKA